MARMMKDFSHSSMYEFTITMYEMWNSNGARGGHVLAWDMV